MALFGLHYNPAYSASFFSRNSIFLSQQFSRNSVFQPISAKRTEPYIQCTGCRDKKMVDLRLGNLAVRLKIGVIHDCPWSRPLKPTHLMTVPLVCLHNMVPNSHVVVHDLAIDAASGEDVVVSCQWANSCLMHTFESSQLQGKNDLNLTTENVHAFLDNQGHCTYQSVGAGVPELDIRRVEPTAICWPSRAQLTLVMGPLLSSMIRSSDMDPLDASHGFTVSPRAMDNKLLLPQSSRLRY